MLSFGSLINNGSTSGVQLQQGFGAGISQGPSARCALFTTVCLAAAAATEPVTSLSTGFCKVPVRLQPPCCDQLLFQSASQLT